MYFFIGQKQMIVDGGRGEGKRSKLDNFKKLIHQMNDESAIIILIITITIPTTTNTNTNTNPTTASEGKKSEIYHAHYCISHRQHQRREQVSCPAGTQERTTFAL